MNTPKEEGKKAAPSMTDQAVEQLVAATPFSNMEVGKFVSSFFPKNAETIGDSFKTSIQVLLDRVKPKLITASKIENDNSRIQELISIAEVLREKVEKAIRKANPTINLIEPGKPPITDPARAALELTLGFMMNAATPTAFSKEIDESAILMSKVAMLAQSMKYGMKNWYPLTLAALTKQAEKARITPEILNSLIEARLLEISQYKNTISDKSSLLAQGFFSNPHMAERDLLQECQTYLKENKVDSEKERQMLDQLADLDAHNTNPALEGLVKDVLAKVRSTAEPIPTTVPDTKHSHG